MSRKGIESRPARRHATGRGPWLAFALLLVGIAWIPSASHRSTSEMLLRREVDRHQFLGKRVAGWLREENLHLVAMLESLQQVVSTEGLSSMVGSLMVRASWDAVHFFHAVRALSIQDALGHPVVRLGRMPGDWSEETREFREALMARPGKVESRLLTDDSLLLVMGIGVQGPERDDRGTVCLIMDLLGVFGRLVGIEAQDLDVSFTLMSNQGDLLLHSGSGMAARGQDPGTCQRCHDEVPLPGGPEGRSLRRYQVAGAERLVVQVPVGLGHADWTLWASTPTRELLRPLSQQQVSLLVFTLLLLVLLLGLGLIVRRQQIEQMRLESRLAEQDRSLRLVQEQERLRGELEEARRMAALGQMVARVAHEVKNPLQYMGTGLELLARRVSGEEGKPLVEDLRTGMRTLNAIVQELLDFSRPMRLDRTPVELRTLIAEVVRRYENQDLRVVLEEGPDLPPVAVDGEKIRQVLVNLVQNAQEAIRESGRGSQVTLRAGRLADGVDRGVWFEVQDDGPGMTDEVRDHLFEPFFTTRTHGSGLGLAVVQRIVAAHGGSLSVRSEPGQGALFRVVLPVRDPPTGGSGGTDRADRGG